MLLHPTSAASGNGDEGGKRKRRASDCEEDSEEDCEVVGSRRDGGDGKGTGNDRWESQLSPTPPPPPTQSRRKWARLLLRELYDLGYAETAACLEREASVRVRSSAMADLEQLVLAHDWDRALALLQRRPSDAAPDRDNGHYDGVVQMQSAAATKRVTLLLLKRKYVELLLRDRVHEALETFQQQILPAFALSEMEIQELAVLLLCRDKGAMAHVSALSLHDNALLATIEELVSPDEVVPRGALRRMLHSNESAQAAPPSLTTTTSLRVECILLLLKHTGEVQDLAFSPDGQYLASSSRDGRIVIWSLTLKELEDEKTGNVRTAMSGTVLHTLYCLDGIPDCVAWSPDSRSLLSCGGDDNSVVQLWNPLTGRRGKRFQHPSESVLAVQWLPDGNHFLTGSAEKSLVLWNANDASLVYQWGGRRVLDLAVHPNGQYFYVLNSENEVRVYSIQDKSDRLLIRSDQMISCIMLSSQVTSSAEYLLLNLIESDEIACLDLTGETIVSRIRGIHQGRYILRPSFAGVDSEVVVCGNEDGSMGVWRRQDGKRVGFTHCHTSVINVVRAHPQRPNLVATASDDETIRVWRICRD